MTGWSALGQRSGCYGGSRDPVAGWPISGAEAVTVRARRIKRAPGRVGLRRTGFPGGGRSLAALFTNARPGASLERTERSRAGATIQLTAESVENPGVHLVILLEGRQIARRITGHLIRIDLSHFIHARLRC